MSSITDVLVTINTQDILADYKTPSKDSNKPTPVANRYIYMTVQNKAVLSGNGTGELNLKAGEGDVIRFREMSLSDDFESGALFYAFKITSSTPPDILENMSLVAGVKSSGVVSTKKESEPKQGDLLHPVRVDMPYHYWQVTTSGAGKLTYHWCFQILDGTGAVVGYFSWDPYITITDA